jgi:hypothetical protein
MVLELKKQNSTLELSFKKVKDLKVRSIKVKTDLQQKLEYYYTCK